MKVISKLLLTIETDIETGDIKLLNREIINDDLKTNSVSIPTSITTDSTKSSTAKLILEDNKYQLNKAAVAMLNVVPGDKIDIKYDKINGNRVPIIGEDSKFGTKGGNKLNKSNTVSFRGVKNKELSEYGTEFTIIPHPDSGKEGLFILDSGKIVEKVEDPNIGLEEPTDIPFDLSIDDLIDDKDKNVEEVDSSIFDFNL